MTIPEKIAELESNVSSELAWARTYLNQGNKEFALDALNNAQKSFDALKLLRNHGPSDENAV